MRIKILGMCACLLAIMIITACAPHQYTGTVLEPPKEVAEFTVQKADGGTLDLHDPGDKPLVLYFGYTSCPDICPNTLYTIRRAMTELGSDAGQFQVAMLTVDPERDTPERLDTYMKNFDPSYFGLYEPNPDQLAAIQADFGIFAAPDPTAEASADENYTLSHSSYIFVVDGEGMHLLFSSDDTAETIAADLRAFLQER